MRSTDAGGGKRPHVSVYETLGGAANASRGGRGGAKNSSKGGSRRSGGGAWSQEDELHNLFFEEIDLRHHKSGAERARARRLKKLARRIKGRGRVASAWAEFGYFDSSDDEASAGGAGANSGWQQHYREDWKWWDDEDERRWFEEQWRQHTHRQEQQQRSHGGTRQWWEQFESAHEQQQQRWQRAQQQSQQQQQYRQQQQQQQGAGSRPHAPSVLLHLQALGLPSTAALEPAIIKAAFHKAAMQARMWHPDKHLNAGQAARCLAEDKFKAARSAYEALIADHRGG
ncbi:hypothetical protein MNEG_5366 [Monoraphidium neglectum]|uniref:J domain-containing protein n=1 Tax=Monoraphidium neglectum TaxID=145388 RepID=A0A0D2L6S3_9CHLO|nr:hypothetical protein MNEG_5366 [Monoraphidium neglectum]KIZ02594.1 hypothetical protein MNEG_5366 [Monoraphidium neglectum]|eukprot:XP_013901613.1 hypothetical protein MNEG_5366 [Monoraphidium neglectum]